MQRIQRITKILHNGSESGSEWARDLATYVYATHNSKSRAKITCVALYLYMAKSRAHSLPLSLPLCKIFVIRCTNIEIFIVTKIRFYAHADVTSREVH